MFDLRLLARLPIRSISDLSVNALAVTATAFVHSSALDTRLPLGRHTPRGAPTRLTIWFDPPAEDLVHHVKLTAEQEVHRSVAAAKDVTGLGVDLF